MKELNKIFESFNRLKVLIIGDVMLDSYVEGKVTRISPEAPVPIVSATKQEYRLGGAANVALNVQSLGATPLLCSVIGDDERAKEFLNLMKKQKLSTDGIVKSFLRITTMKTRVIGNNHQLLRVDSETEKEITVMEATDFFHKTIKKIIAKQKPDVIIFEDYDKGVITKDLIEWVVLFSKSKNIPVAVDPKKKNFLNYKTVSLFKPNLKELKEGLKMDFETNDEKKLIAAVEKLKKQLSLSLVLVTLSEKGILFNNEKTTKIIPAHIRKIADVSGAGDTVISVAALCLALKLPPEIIASLSNLAGGLVCESVGVVPIDKEKLLQEAQVKLI